MPPTSTKLFPARDSITGANYRIYYYPLRKDNTLTLEETHQLDKTNQASSTQIK